MQFSFDLLQPSVLIINIRQCLNSILGGRIGYLTEISILIISILDLMCLDIICRWLSTLTDFRKVSGSLSFCTVRFLFLSIDIIYELHKCLRFYKYILIKILHNFFCFIFKCFIKTKITKNYKNYNIQSPIPIICSNHKYKKRTNNQ